MKSSDTIINARNMTTVYSSWFIMLAISLSLMALTYVIQYTTPYISTKSPATWITFTAISGIAFALVIMFKFAFHREVIAWTLCQVITLSGMVVFLVYGWNWLFVIFFGVSLATQLALGPYLHFE